MLDLWEITANLFWILGLSTLLAAWSYAYYEARTTDRSMRQLLATPGYDLAITAGLVLFCAGLAATGDRWWAQLLWIILGLVVIVNHIVRR